MKVEKHNGTLAILENQIELVLMCITNTDEKASERDSFEEIEKISFKESVGMVLLHINSSDEDTAFITALALDRIRAYARKCGRHNICVCLHRPSAQEFRSISYWTKCFSISYEEVRLREEVLADVVTVSG